VPKDGTQKCRCHTRKWISRGFWRFHIDGIRFQGDCGCRGGAA
jgi:hypothetical protein